MYGVKAHSTSNDPEAMAAMKPKVDAELASYAESVEQAMRQDPQTQTAPWK